MNAKRIVGMVRNVRNFPSYLLCKWGIGRQEPFILFSRCGISVEVPKRMMHTAKEVFFTDDYQFDRIKEQVLTFTDAPVIMDVGANVGYLSAFAFTRFPNAKVISVEPIPKNLQLLERNRTRNAGSDWTVISGVLADREGVLEIQFDNSDSFSTSASMYGLDRGKDKVEVVSRTLVSLKAELGLSSVHILKLDCEGAEYDILYCLNQEELNRIAIITMETHHIDDDRRNRDALVSWLEERGWRTEVLRSKVLAENPNFMAEKRG